MEHGERFPTTDPHQALLVRAELIRRLDWSSIPFALLTHIDDAPATDGTYRFSVQPRCTARNEPCSFPEHQHAHRGMSEGWSLDNWALALESTAWPEIVVGRAWIEAATYPDGIVAKYDIPAQRGCHAGCVNESGRYGPATAPFIEGWTYPKLIRQDDPLPTAR